MPAKEDTVTYELRWDGDVVYIGTTNDPDRRKDEHDEDMIFDELVPTSEPMTAAMAKQKEAEDLEAYRRDHDGMNPLYNVDDDG